MTEVKGAFWPGSGSFCQFLLIADNHWPPLHLHPWLCHGSITARFSFSRGILTNVLSPLFTGRKTKTHTHTHAHKRSAFLHAVKEQKKYSLEPRCFYSRLGPPLEVHQMWFTPLLLAWWNWTDRYLMSGQPLNHCFCLIYEACGFQLRSWSFFHAGGALFVVSDSRLYQGNK